MPDIAVICKPNGTVSALSEDTVVRVFAKEAESGEWRITKEWEASIDCEKGLREVRKSMGMLIEKLDGAKAIAGKSITGIAYHLFDAAGFAIFEMTGRPERFLDFIAAQLERSEQEAQEQESCPTAPWQTAEEGCFCIDLTQLSEKKPEISSKMAIMPFLQNETFLELLVLCAHVPPWFERNLLAMGFQFEAARADDGGFRVRIFHAACGG